MTVAELIAALQEMPPDFPVYHEPDITDDEFCQNLHAVKGVENLSAFGARYVVML